MESMVSVVVPVYNVAAYLTECMNSILEQTYRNLDIILVDDGSTDDSGKLCDAFAEREARVRVVHKKNGGLSDARNTGLEMALGEFVIFVDSDDEIDVHMIESMLKTLQETDSDVVICDLVHVFAPEDLKYSLSEQKIVFSREEAICEMWYQKSFLPSAGGKLFKKTLFDKNSFRTGILFEDIDMMHSVFWDCRKIVYQPSKLYAYKHRENSITTKSFSIKDCEILNICQRIREFSEDKDITLQKAAKAYSVVGAMRVLLNAPCTDVFASEIDRASVYLKANARTVFFDANLRLKSRVGIVLCRYCKPLAGLIYKRVNRWK